jgi:hypothetical protein
MGPVIGWEIVVCNRQSAARNEVKAAHGWSACSPAKYLCDFMAVLKCGPWRNGTPNLRVPVRAKRDASNNKSRVSTAKRTFVRMQAQANVLPVDETATPLLPACAGGVEQSTGQRM